MMRLKALTIAGTMLLAACGRQAEPAVDHAWIRLPAVPGRPGAAYFHLRGGAEPATLVAVTAPIAARSELHESMTGAGGMTSMAPLAKVALAPNADVTFAPGGRHVMLFGLSPAAKSGATTQLSVRFGDGRVLTTDAKILAAGDPAPAA